MRHGVGHHRLLDMTGDMLFQLTLRVDGLRAFHLVEGSLQTLVFLHQTVGLATAVEGVEREESEDEGDGHQQVDGAQTDAVSLLVGQQGSLLTDGRQLIGILLAGLGDGGVEGFADLEGDGHRGVTTPSLHVGLELGQHHFLEVLDGVILATEQFVDALVVVSGLFPTASSSQVVDGADTAFGCRTVLGGEVVFIDLCGLVLLPLSVESDGTVDVVTCPLTVDVEWVGPVALFILTDEFGIAVNPDERLAILLGLVVIEGDVHHTGDGVLVSHVGTVVLDNLQVRLIGAFVILVGFVLRQTEARLTHTRDEHQVRIVAHGVALEFLESLDDRLGHIEHGVILAS